MSRQFYRKSVITLDELVAEVFPLLRVRKHTLETYESTYRCWISPKLGRMRLKKISRADVISLFQEPSSQTSANVAAVIKVLFREALELHYVDSSPIQAVKKPMIVNKPRHFLTWEELDKGDFGKYNTQIRFLALHGLRWSEAAALTEDDICEGFIFITRSIHGATKSKASSRVVPLVSEFKLLPRDIRTLRRSVHPYGITVHSLRHTYAYLLKSQGVHVTTAQRLLGHADPKVTLGIYTRVLDHEINDVGKELREMLHRQKCQEVGGSHGPISQIPHLV